MGFDPRRWRPSPGSRPLTTNTEALLAENEALRREVRSLRLQLERLLQGEPEVSRGWEPTGGRGRRTAPAAEPAATGSQAPGTSAGRGRTSRGSSDQPRSRVTVGSSHGISADLVERWSRSLARHPRWQELRIGPPGGLRGLEEHLRRHWWNPSLSLQQELDRRCPGLGSELIEALRGPHSRGRWAVRVAFALYGPRAPEWLGEDPLRVVEELQRRVQQLEQRSGGGPEPKDRQRRQAGSGPESGGQGGAQRQGPGAHRQGQQRSGPHTSGSRETHAVDPRREALACLGLDPGASAAAIKRAYRRLAKAHHPDLGGDVESFRRIDAAYRALI